MRKWNEGYDWAVQQICRSMKDVAMLSFILQSMDSGNKFTIPVSELAKENGVSNQMAKALLQRAKHLNFMKNTSRGVYVINPYVVISTGLTSVGSQKIEDNQKAWGNPPTEAAINMYKRLWSNEEVAEYLAAI